MKLLLDTHSFLWFIEDSPRLSVDARLLIEESTNDVFLSIASLWEIAIKLNIGKLQLTRTLPEVAGQIHLNSMELLPISVEHLSAVAILPLHHRDPFDRLLVAQATVQSMFIISADPALDAYSAKRLW